ncbi:hypothetical protein OH77DRAFT_1521078 [Trametes cingulata]|nr:hypothetical protein OH77DRAFT_1521078 [Trametes cingulata]
MSNARPAISLHLPRIFFTSGCAVEGEAELDIRQLQQDNVQEVHVKLRGTAKTEITCDKTTETQVIRLVRDDVSIWTRGTVYPLPGSDVLRIPFRLQLPPDLPPSFHYRGPGRSAVIMYSVTAVGVRPGTFHFNRRVRQPLVLVQKDDGAGIKAKEQLAALASRRAEPTWRTWLQEEKIRRGLWGDYATVEARCSIPDISPLPLFVPIPFVIKVKTITPPLTRAKADGHPPDKPVFPPAPSSYSTLEFKLKRKLFIRARTFTEKPSTDVQLFSTDRAGAVDEELPERRWLSLPGESDEKSSNARGVWIQRATFRGTFRLDCPPTFALDIIQCEYYLSLRVPFPGLGNDLKVNVPITVSSGIATPISRADRPSSTQVAAPDVLDLPPAYWDASHGDWEDHKG